MARGRPLPATDRFRARAVWRARARAALESCLAFAVASLAGNGFGWMLSMTPQWVEGAPWERSMLAWFHYHPLPPLLDRFMLLVPYTGTNLTVLPALVLIALWLWKRGHRTLMAVQLLLVAIGSLLLNATIKFQHGRNRPDLFPGRGLYKWSSYPSGHAIAVTSLYFTAALLLRRERGWQWPFLVAGGIVLLNCISRLYLEVHWPTDLIGGLITGAVWLAGTWLVFRRYTKAVARIGGRASDARVAAD